MMKRLWAVTATALLAAALSAGCANPLDSTSPDQNPNPPGPVADTVFVTDTLIQRDTVIVSDSTRPADTVFVIDTNFVIDTVFYGDTVIVVDTVMVLDTVLVGDSVVVDTVIVVDTLIQGDTILVADTVVVTDTVVIGDSIVVDTILVVDTLVQEDSVIIVDTVVVTDTLFQGDTMIVVDTVIVYLPDTTSQEICGRLGSDRQEMVWLLRNPAGRYLLEFSSLVESGQPPQTLFVRIDGTDYTWLPRDEAELVLEVDLGEKATIIIWSDAPKALGHSIDICLATSPL